MIGSHKVIELIADDICLSPEPVAIKYFANEIKQSGYSSTNSLFRIPWNEQVNYELLEKIIEFNIQDKAECTTFWRK
ncbi:hypothetical protein DT065_16180 [Salicibibacter kimchii]|uniref:Uncharacterized protein n=1 Tax=Salicibibacter kimchii TaxID=2099786 RepID=A0A345C4A1_9BACI|nr:hypothetical protein DT065_16180 [Salicibibacter kimchii]